MKNFKEELLLDGKVWFLKSSLKELKAATAEELEELLTLITTEIDYSEINAVRKYIPFRFACFHHHQFECILHLHI